MNRATDKLWGDPVWAVKHWGNRRGRKWTDDELITAHQLRQQGCDVSEIAIELKRSPRSIYAKLNEEVTPEILTQPDATVNA